MHDSFRFFAEKIDNEKHSQFMRWVAVAVAALAVAGLLALALAFARTPAFRDVAFLTRFFHVALVVHVNLSVLVWFLAVAALFWLRLAARTEKDGIGPVLGGFAWWSMALGTLLMAFSPFHSEGGALMSNYIPVITNVPFFLGLGLIAAGVLLCVVRALLVPVAAWRVPVRAWGMPDILDFGSYGAAMIALLALAAFVWSYMAMPSGIVGQMFYEFTFWGGGHTLQFAHTQFLILSWLVLAAAAGLSLPLKPWHWAVLLAIGPLVSLSGIYPYFVYALDDEAHQAFFTHQMIHAGGLAPGIVAVALLWALVIQGKRGGFNAYISALWSSLVLFGAGGVISLFITGQDTRIPAHYHGSIVGISLAFMGLIYALLPEFGARTVARWKAARVQPVIYGVGQLMHIGGLAYSGGYQVLRKTPGGFDGLPADVKAALGFVGLGGLLSIIGGFLFVYVVARAWYGREKRV